MMSVHELVEGIIGTGNGSKRAVWEEVMRPYGVETSKLELAIDEDVIKREVEKVFPRDTQKWWLWAERVAFLKGLMGVEWALGEGMFDSLGAGDAVALQFTDAVNLVGDGKGNFVGQEKPDDVCVLQQQIEMQSGSAVLIAGGMGLFVVSRDFDGDLRMRTSAGTSFYVPDKPFFVLDPPMQRRLAEMPEAMSVAGGIQATSIQKYGLLANSGGSVFWHSFETPLRQTRLVASYGSRDEASRYEWRWDVIYGSEPAASVGVEAMIHEFGNRSNLLLEKMLVQPMLQGYMLNLVERAGGFPLIEAVLRNE